MNAAALARCFELVAERGDPVPLVYARLFAAHPEMEVLFARDTNGNVRGNMLAEAITALADFTGDNNYGGNLFRAEIVNHEHIGVPPPNFLAFFSVMRDTFAEMLGRDWTPEFETAWDEVISAIDSNLRVTLNASEAG
jgi:hemoglobin-like flavoprotein